MQEQGIKLLNLMFHPGETICVSPNKFGFHSMPLESVFQHRITLVSPNPNVEISYCHSDQLTLVALNPIHGFREDANCKSYRNFLIEMDTGPLSHQLNYIKHLELPYSAVIFSGNKSLHFLISLDQDLPSEKVYRLFSRWILTICTLADQNTINPSRSIRIPGAQREGHKRQAIVEFKGKVKLDDLKNWLMKHMDARPKEDVKKPPPSDQPDFSRIPEWVIKKLINGVDRSRGRNKEWFVIGCNFAIAGYSEDDTLDLLFPYFHEERDFKEREWKTTIKSAFKKVYSE